MSNGKITILFFLMTFLAPFLIQSANADNPNWKDDQAKMFDQIQLKPGDVVDMSNWNKVKDILPESVVNWVKRGDVTLKIGEFKFDFSCDNAWIEASAKNVGKYTLGKRKEIIEVATGKYPMWIYGLPFPNVDTKNDPDAGIKIMHNQYAGLARKGTDITNDCSMDYIGKGGYERSVGITSLYYYFWQRPDGEQPNHSKYQPLSYVPLLWPYDVKGITTLTCRPLDGTADQVWSYIPTIRRVKRVSGANRSDPVAGSDAIIDDENGWVGQNESMKWTFLEEKIILYPFTSWVVERPRPMKQHKDGSWRAVPGEPAPRVGWQEKDWQGAQWAMANAVWVPRKVYVLTADPIDRYYRYGKQEYYIDKNTLTTSVKIVYNKAGEYWKTVMAFFPCTSWGDKKSFGSVNFSLIVDDRTGHATIVVSGGKHMGLPENEVRYMDPSLKRTLFTPEKTAMWYK